MVDDFDGDTFRTVHTVRFAKAVYVLHAFQKKANKAIATPKHDRGGSETMMQYKGYSAKVEFDDDAGVFHGEVLNLRDVITFEGRTVAELRQAFRDSVDDYLDFCRAQGEPPEKPYSGRFVLRIDPTLHKSIATRALLSRKSLNAWVQDVLESATR